MIVTMSDGRSSRINLENSTTTTIHKNFLATSLLMVNKIYIEAIQNNETCARTLSSLQIPREGELNLCLLYLVICFSLIIMQVCVIIINLSNFMSLVITTTLSKIPGNDICLSPLSYRLLVIWSQNNISESCTCTLWFRISECACAENVYNKMNSDGSIVICWRKVHNNTIIHFLLQELNGGSFGNDFPTINEEFFDSHKLVIAGELDLLVQYVYISVSVFKHEHSLICLRRTTKSSNHNKRI